MNLSNRVAMVTGAGQGIGKAIALKLAQEGADVAIIDLNADTAAAAAAEVKKLGRRALGIKADITKSSEVNAGVAKIVAELGRLDILVNNAGWDVNKPFIEKPEELWDKIIAINYKGPLICTRAALDPMIKQTYGKIVFISSDAARIGSSGEAVYAGCKAGVIAFGKTIAKEMARYKINVNCVCPGPTRTAILEEAIKARPELIERMVKLIPFRRIAEPEDIAKAVAFFCSDEAAYITGQVISVSGGLTMVG